MILRREIPVFYWMKWFHACLAVFCLTALSACKGKPSATPPAAIAQGSFTLEASQSALTIRRGGSQTLSVSLKNLDGFSQAVKITCPSGIVGLSFSPDSFTLSQDQIQTLQISASISAEEGDRQLTLVGSYDQLSSSLALTAHIVFPDLPILYITTTDGLPIVSKDVYKPGHMVIDPNGNDATFAYDGGIQIRGRGNSTWGMPKKPYRIKLDSKSPLFGFPKSKDWVLLANYADKTLMRNAVAMELSKRLDLAYTPRNRSVEVFLNGDYQGTYLFIESIKVAKDRVNIDELKETDIGDDVITGGYLLEVDERKDQPVNFDSAGGLPINLHDPDFNPPVPKQFAYIKDHIKKAEDALFGKTFTDPATGYENYFDVDSFINWFLVNEVFSNVDGKFFSSCYFYKKRDNEKLFMGPVWDFDLGAGNDADCTECVHPNGWWVHNGPWLGRMFADPAFEKRVKDRWNAIKTSQLDTIFSFIDDQAILLDSAQTRNFVCWPILGIYVWPNAVWPDTYQGEVDYLKTWLTDRIAWMDKQFNP